MCVLVWLAVTHLNEFVEVVNTAEHDSDVVVFDHHPLLQLHLVTDLRRQDTVKQAQEFILTLRTRRSGVDGGEYRVNLGVQCNVLLNK